LLAARGTGVERLEEKLYGEQNSALLHSPLTASSGATWPKVMQCLCSSRYSSRAHSWHARKSSTSRQGLACQRQNV